MILHVQRAILLLLALAAGWLTFFAPPRVLRNAVTQVDAAPYCRAETNRQESSVIDQPLPRRPDGTVNWAAAANVPAFDWAARYAECLADAQVDTPRLALQLLVALVVAGAALLFVRTL